MSVQDILVKPRNDCILPNLWKINENDDQVKLEEFCGIQSSKNNSKKESDLIKKSKIMDLLNIGITEISSLNLLR